MRHPRNPVALILPALLGLLVGCASLSDLEPPELTLVGLQPVEATLFETTLRVRLRLANPNPEPLDLEGLSLKLTLDGVKIGRGMTSETATVARLETAVVELDFFINNASLLLRLRETLKRSSVAYEINGKLYLQRSYGRKTLRVSNSGELDLTALDPP